MEFYRMKHIPTGLYYQPHKYRGSNLSIKGKIYHTKTNGLSSALSHSYNTFDVYCAEGSQIHRKTFNIITWEKCKWQYGQMKGVTLTKDWKKEPLNISGSVE